MMNTNKCMYVGMYVYGKYKMKTFHRNKPSSLEVGWKVQWHVSVRLDAYELQAAALFRNATEAKEIVISKLNTFHTQRTLAAMATDLLNKSNYYEYL